MRKLTLLITMLFLSVGMAWAQLADGVYTINNTINNRGTMCFGTSGGTEYLGLTGITYTGLSGKSVTVTEDANKYWYVQTVNGTTYIYNIGKGVFLKDSGADVATSDSNCNGFTLVTKSSGGTSYISVMNGSRYLTFSPGYEASAGQVRWRTVEEGDAVYLTFTPVENGTVTYKTQVTAAKSKILLSTANETGAVYTIEGGSLNEHRGFLAAGEGYNDYPVLSDIAWSSHSSKSTPAIDNGKNWYVYRKAENEWYIYNVALEKFLAAEDGNINFSPFPYSWVIAENTQGGVNYLVIKDASKGVSFACGSTPSDRNVKYHYEAGDGGSMHIFTPAQGDFSAQIAANVKAKLNMPAPGSYIRIKSVATEAYLSSVNHATQTTRAAYVADADVTTIFKIDGTSLYSYASRQYLVDNNNFLGYGSTESGATIEFQAANVSLNLENAYSIKLFGANRWLYAQPDNYTDAGSGNNDDNYSFYLDEVTELPVAHINNVGYTTLEDAKTAALATTEAVEIVLLAGSDATIVFPANVTINKNGFTADYLAVAVAKIGDVLYATLAEAVDAAQADQTVVLLKDTEETLVLPAGVKLDKSNVTAPNVNEAAAKVGETLYASIEAALAAAQADETITLVADVTCTEKPVFNNGGVVNVDINGHKFVSSEKARVRCVGNSTVASNNIKFVRGFGWEAYYNADEKFRVFPTLDEAVAYKSGTNAANIYPYEDVVQDKDITFCTTGEQTSTALTNDAGYKTSWDLNGFTVLQETAAGNPLESTVLGEFTLLDSSAEKTGKWIAGAYNGNTGGGPAFIVNRADAHLILQGGTISIARNGDVVNTDGLINTYYGTLTVDGATLQMDDLYGIMAWGGNVVVKSGEFVLGENNRSSVFAKKHYSDASVTINANLGGTLYAHSSATATVNVPGVKYYVSGTDYVAPDVAEGLVAQGGVVGYPVAKIGEAGYLTLQAALAAVQDGETITLIDNVTVSEATAAYNDGTYIDGVRYTGDKSFTVDFNGKTVTDDGCVNDYLIYINNKGEKASEITFTNGTIVSANGCWSAVCVNSSAATQNVVLNLNGMNITNSNDAEYSGNPVVRARDLATVNVNDGTIITSNGASYGVAANTDGSTLNINEGATIVQQNSGTTGGNSVFAAVGGKGVINIKGGTITSDKFGVHTMTTGTPVINISGGTITAPVALKSSTNGGNGELATINVTGGTINGTLETYTENGKIVVSGGTFSEAVAQEYCAEGFVCEANSDGTYGVQFASYIVLPEGVNSSNYAAKFGDNTVTDGTNYYATLQAAVEAVAGQANAVLYCKPGADVGSLQHAPVTSTLTVYGNGADVTGDTERDFDLGNTDPSSGNDITADMTLTVKHLNGCGAWGNKATEHTVNLVFENCANMGKVFITGTTGTLNITMTDCAFEGVIKEAVYSNADGAITLTNVAFSNLNKAVNLNHKAAGTQTVTINGCTFTNCGADVTADQIPVRVLSSVEGGKSVLTVTGSTFTGTPEGGADILLDYGVGLTTASVSGTAANVVVEKENNVGTTTAVKAEETVEFTTALPVAKVGEQGYETFADAYNAAQEGETITLLQDVKLAGKLTIGKAVTIDGDGHSIIADETAVWYTVSGKLNIKSYKTHLLGVNAGGIVLKNVVLDCNNNAAGINVYGAQGVVFDNVSIINATKGMAALTVNGSTVNFKTAFTALGNSIAMDISNGSGVTSALGVTVDEGTVFNLGNKVVKFDSVANVETLANAVDAEGKAYFAAKDNAYYYTIAQMESRTTAYSNGLTLLADVELANNALNVKGTLNLNGHRVVAGKPSTTLPDGFAALQNLDGKYVIGTRPTATIENLGSMVVEAGEYFVKNLQGSGDNSKDMPLQFVMKYTADQTAADVATSPYKEWYADFVLSFTGLSSGSFVADEDTYLAGFYGETEKWEGIWAKVGITGMEITEGTRYPVMMGVGMPQNYEYICAGVEEFLCAMNISSEILAANPDLKVTLELCVVDNSNDELALNALQTGSDKCNVAAVKEFVAEDFEKVELPEVVITDIKDSLKDSDPDLTFALNFAIKDVESLTDEYLEKLFAQYGDWYTDYVLTISGLTDEDVTFNADGSGDGYLAGQYDAWSENWVSVPFEDVTLANGASIYIMEYAAKLMGQSGLRFTLREVAEIVQNFDCGVYFTPEFLAANPGLKVDLHLKVFTEDAEGNKVNDINVATNNFDIEDYVAIVHATGKQTQYCTTLADAVAAAQAGDEVTLIANVELSATQNISKSITIDGNGNTITTAESVATNNHAAFYIDGESTLDVTIKNATFDGVNGCAVRSLDANVTIDNCVFQNGTNTGIQGLVRLTQGNATVKNSKFLNNTCPMVLSFNYDAGNGADVLVVDNCQFEGNKASTTAVLYYVKGAKCTIKDSEFIENTLNCSSNGATIYLGFTENNVVTGNLFENNTVIDASTSTRVAGAIFFGYEAEVSGNAFVNNTASNANGDVLGQVCTSTYYDCTIDLDGNYWGGNAPAYGADYTVQHQTGEGAFALNSYYTVCGTDENGNVVLSDKVEIKNVAKVGKFGYASLQAAVEAAQAGETVTMLGDVELTEAVKVVGKAITLDLNGKTVSGTCNAGQSSLVYIENNAALTVVDNSDAKDGKLTYAKGTSNVGWTVDVKGAFTLEEGTVELTGDNWSIGYAVDVRPNSWGTEYTNPSVFTMNGGKLVSSDGAVRVASSSAPAHKQVAASFEMNGGAIDAAWDGVFVQQSDATYDVLSFTMNGGTIESGLNPVRVYGPAATGYVNGADCMNISFNGGTMTYTGTETREWVIDGILRVGGGSSMETILESGNITATAEFADANALPEGYQWEQDGETYKVVEAPKAPEVVDGKIEFVDGEFDMYTNDTDIENVEITYKRTIDSDWNALYVPFAIPASELLADFDIAYINDVRETDEDDDGELDGWQMELIKIKKETAVLRANHPYFVRSKSADYTENNLSLTLTTTLYKATVAEFECSSVYSTYTVKGLNELRASTEFGDADRVLGYDNGETTWGKMADGYSLKPFRFYLTITNHDGSPVVSSSAQMSIVVRDEDGTTGIDGIYGDESGETVIFDLYGRRVLEPEKGNIYIINGKKVLVK